MASIEKTWDKEDAALRDVFAQCSQAIEDSTTEGIETLAFDHDIDNVCTLRHNASGRRFSVRIHELS